jgi:hypothetical protein
MSKTYCSEVLSSAPTQRNRSEHRSRSDIATGPAQPQTKVLLIVERVDGFFLQRLTDRGVHLGETQHDTMDEAMSYALAEYDAISDWRFCPGDVDPLDFLHAESNG